jgi:hypothetical protein
MQRLQNSNKLRKPLLWLNNFNQCFGPNFLTFRKWIAVDFGLCLFHLESLDHFEVETKPGDSPGEEQKNNFNSLYWPPPQLNSGSFIIRVPLEESKIYCTFYEHIALWTHEAKNNNDVIYVEVNKTKNVHINCFSIL